MGGDANVLGWYLIFAEFGRLIAQTLTSLRLGTPCAERARRNQKNQIAKIQPLDTYAPPPATYLIS